MEKIYQVFMGKYAKDFDDLSNKLDYVKYMRFDSILLTPFFESPSYHGYDCTDFFGIKKEYGTMEDFKNFIKKLEELNMDCYIDFPVCHTSDEHILFTQAIEGKNDCYTWSDTFPDKEHWYPTPMSDCSWYKCEKNNKWYMGVWGNPKMPSLNIHSNRAKTELYFMFHYWLTMSPRIHARLDAILYWDVVYATAIEQTHWVRGVIQSIKPGTKIIGEVWDNDPNVVNEFSNALGSCFSFADAAEIKNVAYNNQEYHQIGGEDLVYFCSNHDQTRLMNSLGHDINKMKRAFDLLYGTQGKALVVYYGDEIGMTGVVNGLDHYDVRRPMDWNEVDRQKYDPNSLLNHVRNLNLNK